MTTHIHVRHVGGADHAVKIAGDGGVLAELQPGQATDVFVAGTLVFTEIPLETAQDEAPASFSLQTIGQGVTGNEPTEHPAAAPVIHNVTRSEDIARIAVGDNQAPAYETDAYDDGAVATGVAPPPDVPAGYDPNYVEPPVGGDPAAE